MQFPEDFLHYIWKFRLFNQTELCTISGESIRIIQPGFQNTDAGPDFQEARIVIAETIWAGNVEVHIKSSDWNKHCHDKDEAYNNVILHVVYEHDATVFRQNGSYVPSLALKNRIAPGVLERYEGLQASGLNVIPCAHLIAHTPLVTWKNWLTRVLIQRLEKKSKQVLHVLEANKGNWEETFYQLLAANFGFKTNAFPFELLAKSLPRLILAKHRGNSLQINALIFGQSGFLDEHLQESYPIQLFKEYQYLRRKYNLDPIDKYLWKFLRLRPLNFPTIRLAQFAALISNYNQLFSRILEITDINELKDLFRDIRIPQYWHDHYLFNKAAGPVSKYLGKLSVDNILINTVAVCLFSYGKHQQQEVYIERALALLENIPAESNLIVRNFLEFGVEIENSYDSQAVIELKKAFCDYKKCLNCAVGNNILNLG
jgi:hypothetical protein